MGVLIENYRGWDIVFSTNDECFCVESETWDQREKKRTYSACKSFIDDYIKNNAEFKPFRIQHTDSGKTIVITGIRKDGRLVYEEKGKKEQLPGYVETNYVLFNADNEPIFEKIKEYKAEIEVLRANIETLLENVSGTPLKQYKQQILLP